MTHRNLNKITNKDKNNKNKNKINSPASVVEFQVDLYLTKFSTDSQGYSVPEINMSLL